jgi:hypothetical protein
MLLLKHHLYLSVGGLVEKKVVSTSPMNILYQLTDKGDALAAALVPMEKCSFSNILNFAFTLEFNYYLFSSSI